jgi:type II secretory pathway component PulJ
LLTLHWLVTVVATVVAAVALVKARRANKRLERLTETYWELRYDYGQLRARLDRVDPPSPTSSGAATGEPELKSGSVNFVPLSSLKR